MPLFRKSSSAVLEPGVVFVNANGYTGAPSVGNPARPYQTLHAGMIAAIIGGFSRIEVAKGNYVFGPADPILPIFNGDIYSESAKITGNGANAVIGDTLNATCRFLGNWTIDPVGQPAILLGQACELTFQGRVPVGNVQSNVPDGILRLEGTFDGLITGNGGEIWLQGDCESVLSTAGVINIHGNVNGPAEVTETSLIVSGFVDSLIVHPDSIAEVYGKIVQGVQMDGGGVMPHQSVGSGAFGLSAITTTGGEASIFLLGTTRLIANAAATHCISATGACTVATAGGFINKPFHPLLNIIGAFTQQAQLPTNS